MNKKVMLSCEEATLYAEKALEKQLSKGELFQLKFHSLMCSKCNKYIRTSVQMDGFYQTYFQKIKDSKDEALEKLMMGRIIQRLKNNK